AVSVARLAGSSAMTSVKVPPMSTPTRQRRALIRPSAFDNVRCASSQDFRFPEQHFEFRTLTSNRLTVKDAKAAAGIAIRKIVPPGDSRHCERSEAIQGAKCETLSGLLRCPSGASQ